MHGIFSVSKKFRNLISNETETGDKVGKYFLMISNPVTANVAIVFVSGNSWQGPPALNAEITYSIKAYLIPRIV